MGRKRSDHQWVRDDQDGDAPQPAQRRDQTENRAEKKALDAMIRRLLAITPPKRVKLGVPEDLIAELAVLERQGPKSGRRRQMLRVQGVLRTVDLDALRQLLDDDTQAADSRLERWRRDLLAGGDEALQRFLDEHPDGDRQQIRTLTRQARGGSPAARRAYKRLYQALKAAFETARD